MIDKNKKIWVCSNGHKLMQEDKPNKCPWCNEPMKKSLQGVITKEK